MESVSIGTSMRLPAGLPPEIWHRILSLLDWVDRPSIKAVALTSHGLYEVVAPILFRTLHLHFKWRKWFGAKDTDKGPYPTRFCRYVRTIVVTGDARSMFPCEELSDKQVEFLFYLFGVVKSLQNFYWWHEKYMPGVILYQLYKHCPQVEVHIASSKLALCQRIHPKRTPPPQFSCIRSITAEWYMGEYDVSIKPHANVHYPARLKDIICRTPNLEILRLVQRRKWRPGLLHTWPGLEMEESEAEKHDRGLITLQEGDMLPKLKHLYFRFMRFSPAQSVLWTTQLQWKSVKSLSLINVDWIHLLPKITGCLRDLESLEIIMPDLHVQCEKYRSSSAYLERVDQLYAFLRALPCLKTFVGCELPQNTLTVLANCHTGCLHHLRFRAPTRQHYYHWWKNMPPEMLPLPAGIEDLLDLPDQFPNLQSLGLYIDWASDEEMPYDLLATIRRFPHLQRLELNFPNLCPANYTNFNEATCQALIQSLDTTGPNFLSLHIILGDWYSFEDSKPLAQDAETIIGKRDQAGCIHFHRIRQSESTNGKLPGSADLVGRLSLGLMKDDRSSDLPLSMECTMSSWLHGNR